MSTSLCNRSLNFDFLFERLLSENSRLNTINGGQRILQKLRNHKIIGIQSERDVVKAASC